MDDLNVINLVRHVCQGSPYIANSDSNGRVQLVNLNNSEIILSANTTDEFLAEFKDWVEKNKDEYPAFLKRLIDS